MPIRKIIHIDMDCFYAAIELLDHPELKGQPIAVGGTAHERGVLSTCNYEARQYGLHSAMPTARAQVLCPPLILLPPRFDRYRLISQRIHQIFRQYTEHVESISLDEAYLDVTECQSHQGSATWIAQAIRQKIYQQERLTASAGIAPNKLLAKIASEWNKPNGQYLITPSDISAFMQRLPIEKMNGIGPVSARKLHQLGIRRCGELQGLELSSLIRLFGQWGYQLYQRCRGIDDRPLETERIRKSVSVEETFAKNLPDKNSCLAQLPDLYEKLQRRLKAHHKKNIIKLFAKIKFFTFKQTTVECSTTQINQERYSHLLEMAYDREKQPVRLLGLGVRLSEFQNTTLPLPFDLEDKP